MSPHWSKAGSLVRNCDKKSNLSTIGIINRRLEGRQHKSFHQFTDISIYCEQSSVLASITFAQRVRLDSDSSKEEEAKHFTF